MAGQSINDRLTAARYSLAGQGLAKSVCKATTEEVIGPKKKHLDYLLHCTNEPNVSIPQLANLLIERSQQQSWVTVFKALITVHHMMCYGNERFTQYLASSNCNFNLGGFLDKTGTADQPQLSYDMSTFIRRYAKYINEKAISYRGVAFDFCKTKRGKDDGTLRLMPTDTLLKTLPVLQAQVDALLDFDCTANELNNGVISSAFLLLFRDLIRLFACYNDGIINLLEKYFEMNKKQARDALDCYKKFLIRMDRVSEFLKVAETIGMDKSEIPDLKQAPSSLLDALETHLASLEGKKVPATSGAASGVNLKNAVSVLDSTSSSFGLACSNGRVDSLTTNGSTAVDELTRRAALAEEEAMYEKLKSMNTGFPLQQEHGKNNPFLSSPSNEPAPVATPTGSTPQIIDFFGAPQSDTPAPAQQPSSNKASDDLLQLGNPFAGAPPAPGQPVMAQPLTQMYTNGFSTKPAGFVTENSFDAVFGNNSNADTSSTATGQGEVEANPFADMGLTKLSSEMTAVTQASDFDGYGDILKPDGAKQPSGPVPQATNQKLISSDLDMSLSSLVENLNIKGPAQKPQWNSPKAQSKTGGTGWTMSTAPTAGAYRQPAPMAQPQWNQPPMGGFPPQPTSVANMGGQAPAFQAPPEPVPPTTAAFDPFGGL